MLVRFVVKEKVEGTLQKTDDNIAEFCQVLPSPTGRNDGREGGASAWRSECSESSVSVPPLSAVRAR